MTFLPSGIGHLQLVTVFHFNQGADIENQTDVSVAQNGAAGDASDIADIVGQPLDDRLLLTENFIHLQAKTGALVFHDHEDAVFNVLAIGRFLKDIGEAADGEEFFPDLGQFLTRTSMPSMMARVRGMRSFNRVP